MRNDLHYVRALFSIESSAFVISLKWKLHEERKAEKVNLVCVPLAMLESEGTRRLPAKDCRMLDALLTKYFSRPRLCVSGIILLLNTNKWK